MITFITKLDGTVLKIYYLPEDVEEMSKYLFEHDMKLNVDYRQYTVGTGWKVLA